MEAPRPRSADKYSDSFMLHTVAPRYVYCKHQATNKSSKMLRMKTIDEIRYSNLEQLVMDAARPSNDLGKGLSKIVAIAAQNGKSLNRAVLYQILTKKKTAAETVRNVGDDLARKIEDALKLDTGWLDNPREMIVASNKPSGINADVLSELVLLLGEMNDATQKILLGSARDLLDAAGSAQAGAAGSNAGSKPE